MGSIERELSRDRDLVKHHHSFSDDRSRLHIPMWDSSDPERAPPPLPLNPGSPSLTTRANTSAMIQAAAKALEEKARESMPASAYVVNPMPSKSPERSLIKGAHHRRMQSMQSPSVKDMRNFLDGNRTPDRSPERQRATTPTSEEPACTPPDRSPTTTRHGTPTPSNRDLLRDPPNLRPSSRPPPRAILGENGPPTSSTVLAMQNMQIKPLDIKPLEPKPLDPPLSDVTNSSSARAAQNLDSLSAQILSLTNIASGLQKEMANLSRRSRDNATDLISLKEATNQRDEDIRKSLKELVTNINTTSNQAISRSGSALSEKHPHTPGPRKSFSLPHFTSPSFFEEGISSPNPFSIEGAASVAMLEKIIREMVTKEGQERLLNTLSKLMDKATEESGMTAKKVTELVEFIKEGRHSQALIRHHHGSNGSPPPRLRDPFDGPGSGPLARTSRDMASVFDGDSQSKAPKPDASGFVSQEMLDLLKKIKDSVASSGGITAEVKALVRDLRGEVLGMGRELGRRFDEADQARSGARALEDGESPPDVAQIVSDGLVELKSQMEQLIRENRRQSSSTSLSKLSVDNNEVYAVVKQALVESGIDEHSRVSRDDILKAVKEAYEAYRPDIEFQQFGLEREEILQCLREGMEQYNSSAVVHSAGITKDDVMEVVQDALKDIQLPKPPTEAQEVREEMLATFRECLEELKPQLAPDMQVEIDQDAIISAVKAGLDGGQDTYSEQILTRLQEIVGDMRSEFQSYSAANGRDTEQVLDALKDGLESLRGDVEKYVDRAQDVTGKDEIIDTLRAGIDAIRNDMENFTADEQSLSKAEILDYIKSEFEHLHATIDPENEKAKEDVVEAIKSSIAGLDLPTVVSRSLEIGQGNDTQDALKEEIEQLKAAVLDGSSSHKAEIMAAIEAGFASVGAGALVAADATPAASNDQVISFIKEELEHLRETLATTIVRPAGLNDKEDIIDAVRESIDSLRSAMVPEGDNSSKEALQTVQDELSHLRETLSSTIVHSGSQTDKEDILEALRSGLQEISLGAHANISDESMEELRVELDQLRQAIATGLAQRGPGPNTDEIMDTVRVNLDDLRSELLKKLDNPERFMAVQGDIIDALNEGIENMKGEVTKAMDKPVDMTVTYEILETLKEGIASIKEEMHNLSIASKPNPSSNPEETADRELTGNEVVLAEDPEAMAAKDAHVVPLAPTDMLRRDDLEKMEFILSQLQTKVENIDATVQNIPEPAPTPAAAPAPSEPAPGSALKEDLVGIESMLKELQASVAALVTEKEDSDAIETILRNTKAKIDELNFPSADTLVTKEQVETLEGGLKAVNDAVDGIAAKVVEDGATKADVAVVEVLVSDLKGVVDEIKEASTKESDTVTKADLDVLGVLCTEMKIKLEEMKLPDAESLPHQADIEQLRGLIHDFRESHDKLKESYESDIAITAKAFDDRKQEAAEIVEKVAGVKEILEEFKEELKVKLSDGATGVESINETVKSLEETIASNFNINADVKELMETVTREFERANGAIEGLKVDSEEKAATQLEKHQEIRDTILADVATKLDEKFDAIMSKYDDAQLMAEAHMKMMEEKSTQQEEVLNGSKSMAEDLKLTIDTLGTQLMGLNTGMTEATEKMAQDSQTVFGRIDESIAKMSEHHDENKEHHQQTQKEVANAIMAIAALQGDVTEYHPRFMTTLQEVLALISQHYEHSQKAQESACQQIRAVADEAKANAEEIKTTFTGLPALLPPPPELPPPAEKYDDTVVQTKLDELLLKASEAASATTQLERLDQIHGQVMATAAEVTAFVATQTKLITEGHESREKEAEEVALLLERRLAQKEQLESDIKGMNDDKESLRQEVEALRREREELMAQKLRINADVSALQMALNIRREELQSMDAKAEKLERRILEGIMDHSRALLIAKSAAKNPTKPKPQRAPSDASQITPKQSRVSSSVAAKGINMALKPRSGGKKGNAQNNGARRIFSLTQISGNAPTGAQAFAAANNMGLAAPSLGSGLKRSQSVKNPPNYMRKSSWGARNNVSREINKENEVLNEESEHDLTEHGQQMVLANAPSEASVHEYAESIRSHDDLVSEAGTQRRHSYGTVGEEGSMLTPSEDGYMYGSSYITGSELSRTCRSTSYGSTTRSNLGAGTAIDEEDEEIDDDDDETSRVEASHLDRSELSEHHDRSEISDLDDDDDEQKTETQTEAGHDEKDTVISTETPSEADSTQPVPAASTLEPKEVEETQENTPVAEAAEKKMFVTPSETDSGLGSELPTATLSGLMAGESEADYFRRMAEEDSTIGSVVG